MNPSAIDLPQHVLTTVHIPVRITDVNYGNHLGNDSVVSILHEARVQYLAMHDLTELKAGGTSLIMRDLVVQYQKEAFYGDVLRVDLFCGEIGGASFNLYYKITCQRKGKNILVATARTGMVCYDYDKGKIARLPAQLERVLSTSN